MIRTDIWGSRRRYYEGSSRGLPECRFTRIEEAHCLDKDNLLDAIVIPIGILERVCN